MTARDSFDGSLNNGDSTQLSVPADPGAYLYVTIDDGNTGNSPAAYDLTLRKQSVELSRPQFILEETSSTARSYRFEAVGSRMEVKITNQSGSTASYAVEVEMRE